MVTAWGQDPDCLPAEPRLEIPGQRASTGLRGPRQLEHSAAVPMFALPEVEVKLYSQRKDGKTFTGTKAQVQQFIFNTMNGNTPQTYRYKFHHLNAFCAANATSGLCKTISW